MTRCLTLLTISSFLITVVALPAHDAAQKKLVVRPEVQPLIGTWRPSQGRADGEDLPKEFLALTELTIRDQGDADFEPGFGGGESKVIGPGQIDLAMSISGSEGPCHGIFKLENDRLTICANLGSKTPRPTEYTAENGSRRVLFVLQRTRERIRDLDETSLFRLKRALHDLKSHDWLREAYRRSESKSNLYQIGFLFHSYIDHKEAKVFLPHAVFGPDGKTPLLSWRVLLLPYCDQKALFNQFRLNEPWDSEHNKRLIERMPLVYTPPGADPKAGLTYYQVFTGPRTFFDGNKKLNPMKILPDNGLSILVVEGGNPVIWTKPDDLALPEEKTRLPQLGGIFDDGMHILHIGGHVEFQKRPFDPAELRKLIGPQGNR